MRRLSPAALADLPAGTGPLLPPQDTGVGIVHLGIGAFHRAHQAVLTEEAMAAAGDASWGICGVTQRSTAVLDQLGPQGGLYSVLVRSAGGTDVRVRGPVRELLCARDDPAAVPARLADPRVRVVTLTVTEKGYRHDPATRRLRTDDEEVRADAAGRPPRTVVGQLARGLQARCAGDAGPVAVLCCDNLPANGEVLAGLVADFCDLLPAAEGERLRSWIAANATFPSSMVDRIVPATTDTDRAEAARLLGVEDHGAVVTEPFRQWVVEDSFAGGRPAWEHVPGVVLTGDVEPYEAMKLRMLNGAHSAIAYLGGLAGFAHVADAVADDDLAGFVRRFWAEEVVPTLDVPGGFDVTAYQHDLLERFANPALRHRTAQIAMDGSQKLPQRLLATARDRLAAGGQPRLTALAIAGWARYVTAGTAEDGTPLAVDDPLAAELARAGGGAGGGRAATEALLGVRAVFGDELPADPGFRALVLEAASALERGGVRTALKEALAG
ncbi:mannitol dehydrogenase family protein [Kineococcus glutinatus]|uniref:Mannitol dehydrogenase family protein n=2 Tax=Kineococcus glutinatus TaxID=1070872 RepID=A0ABP9HCC1_9ACTN